jgi:hypothetical protein
MRTAALYIASAIAIVNSFRRPLARNSIGPSGWQHSQIGAWSFWQRLLPRNFALALAVLIDSALFGGLNASIKVLGLYGQICVTVYDLREGSERGKIRDDVAARISAVLQTKISGLQKLRKIRPRSDCIKPGEIGFDRQFMLALYVKYEAIEVDGKKYSLVIIGGSSPNAAGAFADYDLHPIAIVQQGVVSERTIEEKLVEYVDRNLVSTLRP